MRFIIQSERAAIDALAVFQGFQRVPGRKWVYIHPEEDQLIGFEELPGYFEDLEAAFDLETSIYKTPSWYHYARILHLVCKSDGDASMHASARQRATAFVTIISSRRGPSLSDWPSISVVDCPETEDESPDDFSKVVTDLLVFNGLTNDEAATAIRGIVTIPARNCSSQP